MNSSNGLVCLAAGFIVGAGLLASVMVGVTFFNDSSRWYTQRSPDTGICYEIRINPQINGFGTSMSPVDDSFCEDK